MFSIVDNDSKVLVCFAVLNNGQVMLTLFPPIAPFKQSRLKVSEVHEIHYEQAGNPNGAAALFLHGGPGLGILPIYRRFFDPNHYHIILPDQRGAGRSTPYAELSDNDTWHIVEDLERLRKALGIEQWLYQYR